MARSAQAIAPPRPRGNPDPRGISKFITFTKFSKLNTKTARQNLVENEVAWLENLQPIADNDLQTVPAANSAIATVTGKTATRMFRANIGATDYVIFFATDGSATAVNANTGAQTAIAPAATFSATPDMDVFASSRILIMDPTGGYATWDGSLFVKSGGLSPNVHVTAGGSGYTSNFAVTFTGGHGSGATATAITSGGAVVAINLTNPGTGYQAGDTVTVNLSAGAGTGATATVVIWPIISGTTIAVGFGRVWYGNGRLLGFTGTGTSTGVTWDDINPADAAGSTTISDSDLAHQITAVRFLNNFLYIFGDESVKQIGAIAVATSVTLFTILTLASDIGTTFILTIQSYNRLVLFANKNGVYGIFGATVQKISDDLDGIFQSIDFTQPPQAAVHDTHVVNAGGGTGGSLHDYALLVKYIDPVRGPLNLLLMFRGNKWFIVNQASPIAIVGLPLASTTQWEIFASAGSDVTQLMQNSNAPVQILLITSLTPHNNILQAKRILRSAIAITTASAQSVTMTTDTENGSNSYVFSAATAIAWLNNSGIVVQWQNNALANVNFVTGGFKFPDQDTEGYGKFIGNTVSGSVMLLSINAIADEYEDADMWGKNP